MVFFFKNCLFVVYIILYLISKYLEIGGSILTSPEDVHVLITRICDYVALYTKKDSANRIELVVFELDYLDYPDGPNAITKILTS